MSRYTEDGGVLSSKIPIGNNRSEHRTLFGLYRGVIKKVVYPDDPKSSNRERIEYVVRVNGQDYPNAVNMREAGGINNYRERVRKPAEKASTGEFDKGTFDENLDGEIVYVMFLEGYGNVPIIVGGDQHPRQAKYKKFKKADGLFDETEFNGVKFQVDKDSNYTISQVGRKSKEGTTENQSAVGALIRLGGKDGDILLKSAKVGLFHLDKDGSVKIISADGSIITLNAKDGSLLIVSKDGNTIAMDSSAITISEKKGKSVISINDSQVQITADKAIIQSKEATLNAGAVNLGTGATFTAVIYETMKAIFDAHIHATAVGPSGPPLPPNTMSLMELSPVTSAQAKYIKLRGNI